MVSEPNSGDFENVNGKPKRKLWPFKGSDMRHFQPFVSTFFDQFAIFPLALLHFAVSKSVFTTAVETIVL